MVLRALERMLEEAEYHVVFTLMAHVAACPHGRVVDRSNHVKAYCSRDTHRLIGMRFVLGIPNVNGSGVKILNPELTCATCYFPRGYLKIPSGPTALRDFAISVHEVDGSIASMVKGMRIGFIGFIGFSILD